MFSGIIEKCGSLIQKKREGGRLVFVFQTTVWKPPLKRGESISVNGVCLTATQLPKNNQFKVQAVPETLAQTTLADLRLKEKVNLERSLKWGERIGGHFVLGHIDGIGRVVRRKGHGKNFALQIEVPANVIQHLVPKGSLAVDGVSLTLGRLRGTAATVFLIPDTLRKTTLGLRCAGDEINLEVDYLAKLVRER